MKTGETLSKCELCGDMLSGFQKCNCANEEYWCNHCQEFTETKKWDCKVCGYSKPHPEYKNNLTTKKE